MPLRPLTPKEIESLMEEDKIVWVCCRNPSIPLTQGKFVRGKSPLEIGTGEYPYSFCPFKRGLKTGFLPASHWLIDDQAQEESHSEIAHETLKKMFPSKS